MKKETEYKKNTCGGCLYWRSYSKNPWYGTCYQDNNDTDTWEFKERCDEYRENTFIDNLEI